jgi:hypothetical protein
MIVEPLGVLEHARRYIHEDPHGATPAQARTSEAEGAEGAASLGCGPGAGRC